MAHEADRRLVHHLVQDGQIVVLQLGAVVAQKVVVEKLEQLAALLRQVRKVDKEPAAHVALHAFDLGGRRRPVVFDQEIAILEKAAAADLLRVAGVDQPVLQVVQRLVEIAVHTLADHRGVEVLRHGHLAGLVEEEQRVKDDVERVDGELVLALHHVDKLELDRLGAVVAERDQRPLVGLRHL